MLNYLISYQSIKQSRGAVFGNLGVMVWEDTNTKEDLDDENTRRTKHT
jgi:hypothetical protein